MKRGPTCCVVVVGLTASLAVAAADEAPKPLAEKLASLAGAGARDCGTVLVDASPEAAFACAAEATKAGGAYRFAIEFDGPDNAGWQGVARNAAGKLWTLYFDSDPAAAAGTGNTLSVVPCSDIRFDAKGDDVIRCKPVL